MKDMPGCMMPDGGECCESYRRRLAEIERLLEQVTQWQDLAVDLENRLEAALHENERLQSNIKKQMSSHSVIPGTNISDAGTPSY